MTPEVVWVENHYHCGCVDDDDNSALNVSNANSNNVDESSDSNDEEEEGHGLETDGEWTLLPNGTKQIFNLYKAIADLLKVSGDNLGLHTINTMFKVTSEFEATKGRDKWRVMV